MKALGESPLGHVGYWARPRIPRDGVDHTFQALALVSGVSESLGRAQAASPLDREAALSQAEGRLGQGKLRIAAVAEGVESREEWELLRDLGCDFAQGYYVAKPMESGAFLGWLGARSASAHVP